MQVLLFVVFAASCISTQLINALPQASNVSSIGLNSSAQLSLPVNARPRRDPPSKWTAVVRWSDDGQPLNTVVFNFNQRPISVDDFSMAMGMSYGLLLHQVSTVAGDENATVPHDPFHVSNPYFEFDVGTDLYTRSEDFTFFYIQEILQLFRNMGAMYNMRECTFRYTTPEEPALLHGYIKNAPQIPPARLRPPLGTFSERNPSGLYSFSSYRYPMYFDHITRTMLFIMDYVWRQMVIQRKAAQQLLHRKPYVFEGAGGVIFEIQRTDTDSFSLWELLELTFAVVRFDRRFDVREMMIVVETAAGRRHVAQLARSRSSVSVD